MKDKEVKRFTLEKSKIEALIEKHRPHTPKTPDKVNTSGTGKNAKVDDQEGTKKGKPPYKKATKDIQIKRSHKKGTEAKNAARSCSSIRLALWWRFFVVVSSFLC